ncbi:MAG: MFS transporter [Rhizobiales bacterium]|nr:MFS transporter [Hyphomicrobiales bacterium]
MLQATNASGQDIDGPYAWRRLAISLFLSTVGGVGSWAIVVVLPAIQTEFGVDRAAASLPYTATMVGFAVGNLIVGRIMDRVGFWIPVLASALLLAAGFALSALAPSIGWLNLAQGGLIGLGSGATFGPVIADISHWFRKRRGVAVACAASGSYFAGIVWPMIIPHLMGAFGWRGTYLAIAAICLVAMVPSALMLRRPSPISAQEPPSAVGNGRAAIPPGVLQAMLMVAGVSCCVAMSMPQVHIVAYCIDLGYGVARGADMLALMMTAGVFSRLASGFLVDRIGGVRTLLLGSVAQGLSLFLYIPFDGLASLYVVSLVFGLSQGGIVPCYATIIREYLPASEAGSRVGSVIMATILGMAIGGWMSGWIYDMTGSYTAAFMNGIAWNLLNIAIMLLLLQRSRRRLLPA